MMTTTTSGVGRIPRSLLLVVVVLCVTSQLASGRSNVSGDESNSTSAYDDDDNATGTGAPPPPGFEAYAPWQKALIGLACAVLVVGTVIGNTLVCTAVVIVRRLRTPSNLLIVSLAVSDLLVAILDMPFAAVYEVLGEWVLGQAVCDAWTSLDVLLCTASILNLCMISVDRYFVITRPFQYAMKRTPLRMALMIVAVWAMSALISIPPLFGWKAESHPGECVVSQHIGYQFYATIGAFYLPLTVMIVIYVRIYLVSSRIARAEAMSKPSIDAGLAPRYSLTPTTGSETPLQRKDSTAIPPRSSTADILNLAMDPSRPDLLSEEYPLSSNGRNGFGAGGGSGSQPNGFHHHPPGGSTYRLPSLSAGTPMTASYPGNNIASKRSRTFSIGDFLPISRRRSTTASGVGAALNGNAGLRFFQRSRFNRISSSHERKATKTLGVIMGAFTACWLPFFILALIKPFCADPDTCIPRWLNGLFLWLGFANSLLNPVIYARFNRDFRTPFRHIIQCHVRDINVRLRSDNYAEQFGGGSTMPRNSVAFGADWNTHQRDSLASTNADALVRLQCPPPPRLRISECL